MNDRVDLLAAARRATPGSGRFRPPYPDELFACIADGVADGARGLAADLGAGVGRSSLPLLAWFQRVVAIERDPRLAGRLPAQADRLTVQCCRAEDAELTEGTVGAVVFGNSFLAMDGPWLVQRVSRWLAPGGVLAAFQDSFPRVPQPVQAILDHERRHHWGPFAHFRAHDDLYTARTLAHCTRLAIRTIRRIGNVVEPTRWQLIAWLLSLPAASAYVRTLSDPDGYLGSLETAIARVWPAEQIPTDFGVEVIIAARRT